MKTMHTGVCKTYNLIYIDVYNWENKKWLLENVYATIYISRNEKIVIIDVINILI